MKIFSGLNGLESGLNASWQRNAVILNNVANVDTPGFKASEVEFESLYKNALENGSDGFQLKRTRATHMVLGDSDGSLQTVFSHNTVERMDENNVNIDKEMTDYAKNVIFYNTLQRKINGQLGQLRTAIKGT